MASLIYYTATSLDGFIADPEQTLDWLLSQDIDEEGPMNYGDFRRTLGACVMGANTWQWILDHDEEPWNPLPTWVLTHRRFQQAPDNVRFTSLGPKSVYDAMAESAGDDHMWVVGGGELAGQFHDLGLLEEIWVQYAPVTLGAGAPLLPRRIDLELLDLARNRAFACARYRVVR